MYLLENYRSSPTHKQLIEQKFPRMNKDYFSHIRKICSSKGNQATTDIKNLREEVLELAIEVAG